MYEKARRGETIELSPRRVTIYDFEIERSLEDRFSLYYTSSFYFPILLQFVVA